MSRTMQEFIATLQESYPQEIVRVSCGPLKPHLGDCHALLYQFERQGKWPMGVFDNVETYGGKRWPGSTQSQADGTFSKLAIACDLPAGGWTAENIINTLQDRLAAPKRAKAVPEGQAHVKGRVVPESEVNLFDLPIYRKDEKDAKPGWLCGVAVARKLDTGRYNLSWHRLLIMGEKRSSARIQYRHLWDYMNEYRRAGLKEMPCIWVFGHHPLFMLAGAIREGYGVDEYEAAGAVMGEPLRVTPSATWGADFMIPAGAEAVVEGYLHLEKTDYNGPWSDYMRYYSPQTLEPAFRPTAFNFAQNAVFDQHIARHDLYHMTGMALTLTGTLRDKYPRVKIAYMPAPYTAVVQFAPDHPGEAQRMAHLALVAAGDFVKNVIVVDEDVNPFDLHDVMFAIGTRVDGNTAQVQVVRGLDANRHDPAPMGEYLRTGGVIIDATKPVDLPYPELGYPGEDALKRVPLEEYVPAEKVREVLSGLFVNIHPTRI